MDLSGPNDGEVSFKDKLKALLGAKVDINTISWDDMATAIGPNADKYEKLWQRMHGSARNVFNTYSFCWSAIPFFGVAWAVARKMYLWAAIMFVAMIALAWVMPSNAGALGLAIVMSLTQKSIYLRWLMSHIQLIDKRGLVGEQRRQALVAAGGLNAANGWITAGVLIGISLLLSLAARY